MVTSSTARSVLHQSASIPQHAYIRGSLDRYCVCLEVEKCRRGSKVNLSRGACVDDSVTSVNDRVTGVNYREKSVVDGVASVDHSSYAGRPSR